LALTNTPGFINYNTLTTHPTPQKNMNLHPKAELDGKWAEFEEGARRIDGKVIKGFLGWAGKEPKTW
jgi:hypothetical protein